ncbi:MAG: AAA family ATPase [Muribaculaceae bacterium]|nr:AAA family ATPase [Muribaculaceae bacterium]
MENLFKTSRRLVSAIDTSIHRYLYRIVNWDDRLIMIKGARGVGKTTMLLQRIKETFGTSRKALYASCDNLWFADNKIIDLATYHYEHGGTHLFLDEIHLYDGNWQRELKNIYDSLPGYHVAFTGSSIILLDAGLADLSRRCLPYRLYGLSFREYLRFEGIADFPALTLDDVFSNSHSSELDIIEDMPPDIKILAAFADYRKRGYYPFYRSGSNGDYYGRIERLIDVSMTRDIPAVEKVEYETLYKLKKLLYVMSREVPFTLNVQSLSQKIQVSRSTIVKMFDLLDKGAILRCINSGWKSPKSVAKPDKILFDNTDIMAAITDSTDIGTVRETFVASMAAPLYRINEPSVGDLLIEEKYLLEIGGKSKTFRQIADLPDGYVVADEEESGFGNRIPMWLLGFLY